MEVNTKTSFSNVIIKRENDLIENSIEDSIDSDSGDDNVPFKKQRLPNGKAKLIFKQEPCTSDNDVNFNGADDVDKAVEENNDGQPENEISETVENEASLNRMLKQILNEKKKELLNHPEIIKLFTPK